MEHESIKLGEMLDTLSVIDTEAGRPYHFGMPTPDHAVTIGDWMYAYGPDGFVWFVDLDGLPTQYVDWENDARNLHLYLEFAYGELYKIKAQYDPDLYRMLERHLIIVEQLNEVANASSQNGK